MFAKYRKFVIAGVAAAITAVGAVITDGQVTNEEWIYVVVTALAAAGVVIAPNKTDS